MNGRTHALVGIAVGVLVGTITKDYTTAIIASTIGALLPDIDHPQSVLSGWLPGIGVARWALGVKHRGITHSIVFVFVVTMCVLAISPRFALPTLFGMLSHLALDMLTPAGVPLFLPWRCRVGLPRVLTLIPFSFLLNIASVALIAVVVLKNGNF